MFDEAFITSIRNRMEVYEAETMRLTKENELLKRLLERSRDKQNENGSGTSREPIIPNPGLRGGGKNALSDAQTYGSLFDGLHVYVAGDRQPLGSQNQFGPVGKHSPETCSTTDRKPTRYSGQHSSKQPQSSCYDPQSLQSISLEAKEAFVQWEDGSAAPSTLTPNSPRGDLMVSPSHGVDVGEVRSERHSTLSSPPTTCEDVHANREWMDSSERKCDGAMGPWTMFQDQHAHVNDGVYFHEEDTVGENTIEANRAPESPKEAEI